jgi:uncharacterized oligopeptide transporter (OPT) family protein
MKTVIEGVLSGSLPWGLVGTGAALSITALIAGLPGLAFAVGIYLPLASLTPIFLGGIVRRIVDSRRKGKSLDSDPGVLAASGMIAGEGLAGVAIALFVAGLRFATREEPILHGAASVIGGIIIVAIVCALLYRAGRSAPVEGSAEVHASTNAK